MKLAQLLTLAALSLLLSISCDAADNPSTTKSSHARHAHYVPGLGEFMNGIQMRHAKLWFAGEAQNWPLANYELDELQEAFDDVITYQPGLNGRPVKLMIDAMVKTPLAHLKRSIASKDETQFANAFDKLSQGCSACHAAEHHSFIVIQRPESPPLTNQRFAPQAAATN